MIHPLYTLLLLAAPVAVLGQGYCNTAIYPWCKHQDWHIGADRVKPSGTVVHGHANVPVHQGPSSNTQGTVHGSRVIGGPYNGAQTVGGSLNYRHDNGLQGGVDVTHTRGQGNTYSASAGGSTKVGPGTLTVGGGASKLPGGHTQGHVGANYNVPLP